MRSLEGLPVRRQISMPDASGEAGGSVGGGDEGDGGGTAWWYSSSLPLSRACW